MQNHPRSRAFFNAMQYVQPQAKKEISEDLYYCCPECDFKTSEPNKFQIHALQKHPLSLAFFTGDQDPEKSGEIHFQSYITGSIISFGCNILLE